MENKPFMRIAAVMCSLALAGGYVWHRSKPAKQARKLLPGSKSTAAAAACKAFAEAADLYRRTDDDADGVWKYHSPESPTPEERDTFIFSSKSGKMFGSRDFWPSRFSILPDPTADWPEQSFTSEHAPKYIWFDAADAPPQAQQRVFLPGSKVGGFREVLDIIVPNQTVEAPESNSVVQIEGSKDSFERDLEEFRAEYAKPLKVEDQVTPDVKIKISSRPVLQKPTPPQQPQPESRPAKKRILLPGSKSPFPGIINEPDPR